MGKALILSSLGDGHYAIKVFFDNARVEAKKTAIQDLLTQIDQSLEDLAPAKTQAQQDLYVAWLNLNNAITNNLSYGELADAQQTAMNARRDLDRIIARERQLNLLKTSSSKEIETLAQYAPGEIETTAWCISCNEGLTGETDTIEIDRATERDPSTDQIRNDTGFWIPATQNQTTPTLSSVEKKLQHPLASSAHAVWFNLSILPAMQREFARYRIATLSDINDDNNTGRVTFIGQWQVSDSGESLVAPKPIFPNVDGEQVPALSDVSITYPPCHSLAFQEGDQVIVALYGGNNPPEVIGFYNNPRKCRSWEWTNGLAFDLDGIHRGLGIPQSADQAGPISTFHGRGTIAGGYPTFTHTLAADEESLDFTYIWEEHYDSLTLEYRQTYTRTGHAEQTATETLEGYEKQDYIWETTETIETVLFVNGVSKGIVYRYSGYTTAYDVAPGYGSASYSEHQFEASGVQYCLYKDNGSVKAQRQFQCTGQRRDDTHRMTGSKIISGDLRGLGDEQSSGKTVTNYWGPGHLTGAPIFPAITGFAGSPYVYTMDTVTNLVECAW